MPVLLFRTVLGTGKHQETQGFQGSVPFVRTPIKSQKELFIYSQFFCQTIFVYGLRDKSDRRDKTPETLRTRRFLHHARYRTKLRP
jgi:hypothetical protein